MPERAPGDVARLIEIMAALRTPGSGCPWDLEQDFRSIAPYTIEEAYEVADAVERDDLDDLKDELGDLLLQVVFHARMAQEVDAFAFQRRRRGDLRQARAPSSPCFRRRRTARRRGRDRAMERDQGAGEGRRRARLRAASLLEGVPLALPALTRAVKLQQKASKVGFDWDDARHVLGKIREETEEVAAELAQPGAVRFAGARRGDRRLALCRRQSRAPRKGRSRAGAARRQRQIRTALPPYRASSRRSWPLAGRSVPRRDGSPLGRSERRRAKAALIKTRAE